MFERFSDRVAELGEPMARSADNKQSYQTKATGIEAHKPPAREMDDYWDLFKGVSIVRESIRAFASEVVSDGYYIECENQQLRKELEEWLSECAIVTADVDNDFRKIVEEAIIQQEVRGTALIEVVEDADGGIYGFKSIPPDTVKQYTLPGKSVLLAPDQDLTGVDKDDIVYTDNGEVAAYVQFDDDIFGYNDKEPIGFSREEVIKFTRDADVGEPWGNSRLISVEDRIESLLSKLDNNDKAIESLAWKFWLFKFGTEEQPWPEDKIAEFMSSHNPEEFEPGMKQGVQGNVDIETVSGEVADIENYLGFDIDWIVASMPYPKYGLGGFEENVNQFVSRSQENRVRNQIQEARRDFAEGFNPVLNKKTAELGYNPEAEDPSIVIGLSPEEKMMMVQDDDIGVGLDGKGSEAADETDYTRPPASSEDKTGPEQTRPQMQGAMQRTVWDVDESVEELGLPQGGVMEDEYDELLELGAEALQTVRDDLIETYEMELAGSLRGVGSGKPQHPTAYRRPAERAVRGAMAKAALPSRSEGAFSATLQATYDDLADEGVVEPQFTEPHQNLSVVRRFSDNYYTAIRDAAEEMARDVSHTVRSGLERGEDTQTIRERVETEFNDASIRQSARIVSQMELKNAVETTRLREYERDPDVIGVRPVANCSEVSTPLCRRLAGCDGAQESAVAYFEDGPIGDQLQEEVSEQHLYSGFDPLPSAPPFHWLCKTELAPVRAESSTP